MRGLRINNIIKIKEKVEKEKVRMQHANTNTRDIGGALIEENTTEK